MSYVLEGKPLLLYLLLAGILGVPTTIVCLRQADTVSGPEYEMLS